MVLRWSPDGRQLAFTWNASAIRVLDATAPDGDLIAKSKLDAGIGTVFLDGVSITCDAAQGWQPITVTKGAAGLRGDRLRWQRAGQATPSGTPSASCAPDRSSQESYVGLASGSSAPPRAGRSTAPTSAGQTPMGSEVCGSGMAGGHGRYLGSSCSTFTPLPALPDSVPVPAGVMDGNVAW